MFNKDDELLIVGFINENKLSGKILLKDVKQVFYELIQVGPMYTTFLGFLRKEELIDYTSNLYTVELTFEQVFKLLNSPEFLNAVPMFMNSRGTWDNIRLVVTSLVLLNHNFLTIEDIAHAVDVYTLMCREKKSEGYLKLDYEVIQRTLRVSFVLIRSTISYPIPLIYLVFLR